MKLLALDIDAFCEELPEITNYKEKESCKLSKTGLFSQQIFGPIKSYQCECPRSIYRGPHVDLDKCPICEVDIISSEERSKRFAKIKLPFPILNPLVYTLLLKAKPSAKKIIDNILYYKNHYALDKDNNVIELPNLNDIPDNITLLEGLEGVKKYINLCIETSDKNYFEFIKNNMNLIEINNIIVIPPSFRNFSKNTNGSISTDALNRFYKELLMRTIYIKNLPYTLDNTHDVYKSYFKTIQLHSMSIFNYILERLSKKQGLIRGNILGKRVDFSGRAVISPDPDLKLTDCKIPYLLALEIFKPQFTTYLVNRRVYKRYNQATNAIDECLKIKNFELFDLLQSFCKNKICMLNRQPSLHRLSILSFNVNIHRGNTIKIHPLICGAYNADFDGDAMAVYIPIDNKTYASMATHTFISNNLVSPTSGSISTSFNQDIVLGIYESTR